MSSGNTNPELEPTPTLFDEQISTISSPLRNPFSESKTQRSMNQFQYEAGIMSPSELQDRYNTATVLSKAQTILTVVKH